MSEPLLYEINTRCWLGALSEKLGRSITLASVPAAEFGEWERLGFTHIWLMGVWSSGPRARRRALEELQRQGSGSGTPAYREEDVAGSPYAIADYRVPSELGGEEGLREFRRQLQGRGLKLLLDFAPNHLGIDHPWVQSRPELFVQSKVRQPGTFAPGGEQPPASAPSLWLAHGKDPNYSAWTDTAQLDYRRADTRAAMVDLLLSVAARCDGVRCDMAMLALNDVFARTWARFAAPAPAPSGEFWQGAISRTRQAHPDFLFLAEAYWGTEPRLLALGFDYTYDKALYDLLVAGAATSVIGHLRALPAGQLGAGAHFLENHDERRIASVLGLDQHRAAALLVLGLPGMRFLHEGQLSGKKIRTPVQLVRRPAEAEDAQITALYERLLAALQASAVGRGRPELLEARPAWAGNPTAENFLLVQWQADAPEFDLVVVNLAGHRSQGVASLTVPNLASRNWTMKDLLGPEQYRRAGKELAKAGLYLDLPGYGAQLFHFSPSSGSGTHHG